MEKRYRNLSQSAKEEYEQYMRIAPCKDPVAEETQKKRQLLAERIYMMPQMRALPILEIL